MSTRNIVPRADGEGNVGTPDKRWAGGYFANIYGNSSNLTGIPVDVGTALSGKQDILTTGTALQYFRGNLSLATFPTEVGYFNNDVGYLTSGDLDLGLVAGIAIALG